MTTQQNQNQPQKVVEFYMDTLKQYKDKFKKDKIIVLMQVGEFLEIYGLIYPDGSRVGDLWEFCENVNLKVAEKKQEVYKNPDIKVFMGGVQLPYVQPYIQKAIDKFGWTVVVFEQECIGRNKYERKETAVLSPGINIHSDSYSTVSMVIYIEQLSTYYKPNRLNPTIVNIGVSYVDCITGHNGLLALNNTSSTDISIPFDELLKLLTIKNPKELTIYIQNYDSLTDDTLINALHLFNYQFTINRDTMDDKYSNLNYQNLTFNSVYNKYKGLMDITQQLDIDGAEHYYSRIALTLLLEFILKHDKSIIQKLDKPEIILNSDNYLMLANNSLEQLDIIDNLHNDGSITNTVSSSKHIKRISLLDLLDNTKTPLGKNLFRTRLSTPITNNDILEKRYQTIGELETIHNNYMKKNMVSSMNDKYGSPLYQLRQHLFGIKNIDNYLRKMITHNINPNDIGNYIVSLNKCINVYEYLHSIVSNQNYNNTNNNINNTNNNTTTTLVKALLDIIPSLEQFQSFIEIHRLFTDTIILENLNSNIWNGIENNPFIKGVSKVLDELQEEIDCDRMLLETIINELSIIIEPKFNKDTSKVNICIGDNTSKGIYIYTTKTKKDILEDYFYKHKNQIKIGKYTITHKDIKFNQMKENKWELDIIHLKSSNGTLKVNIEKIGKLVKGEFIKWIQHSIIDDTNDTIETNENRNSKINTLLTFSKFIAEIDVLQSNVLNAIEKGYVCPEIDMNNSHSFVKADKIRHPIIEHISKNTKYVPNDIVMGKDSMGEDSMGGDSMGGDNMGVNNIDGMLLFGVNAVGKSSLMKSIGINIIMAQAGMYVASSHFTYKPYHYLFTRIRSNDNIYAGLSSFEVEMKEFKVILKYANENSIILGDELCSGTETQDATALVASGVRTLSKRKCSFIFATHLHFLADMSYIKELENVKLFHLLVERDVNNPSKLIYSRKLQPGNGPKSYGILVCETMELEHDFILKAKEIRESMNSIKTIMNGEINNINDETQIGNESLNINHTSIGSKYNINKIISTCEICKNTNATDVHHINQQCDANENNIINDNENGIFNKNKLWNLVSLCKKCHQNVHSSPPIIIIEGYQTTSSGIELNYKIIKDNAKIDNKTKIKTNNDFILDINDTILELDNNTKTNNNKSNKNKTNNNNNSSKNNNTIINKIDNNEMNKLIIEMKTSGFSPKKIQYDLKRNYNYEITQQLIRNLF